MSLVTLEIPEKTELALHRLSARQGKPVSTFLVELIDEAERFEELELINAADFQEREAAVAGVQRGLDEYAAGRHRSFDEFSAEMRVKYLGAAETR